MYAPKQRISNIELGSYKLSLDKVRTTSRVNGRRGYIPRPSCLDYAANMEASFGKKLKQARLTAHLSIPQLAALLHINKRRLQHIELNEVSYDNLTPEFLIDAAIVLSLPTGIFLDKYHKFLQGDSAAQLDNWLRANYPSYAEAQRQLGVSEFGLSSWRAGKYPVPRWLYEKMTNK